MSLVYREVLIENLLQYFYELIKWCYPILLLLTNVQHSTKHFHIVAYNNICASCGPSTS